MSSNQFLWLYAPAHLPDNPSTLLVKSYHEQAIDALLSALQNKLPQAELVKAVEPNISKINESYPHTSEILQVVIRDFGGAT